MTTTTSASSYMIGAELNQFLGKKARLEAGLAAGGAGRRLRFIFEDQMTLGDIIEALPGAGDIDLMELAVTDPVLEIEKAASGVTFRFTGKTSVAGLEAMIELDFVKGATAGRGGRTKGGYAFLMKVLFPGKIDLGDVLGVPGVEGILFTNHSLYGLLGFVVTNDNDAGRRYQNLMPGFNFYGGFAITADNEIFSFIGKLLGIQTIDLYLGVNDDAFQMQASLGLQKRLTDSVTLSEIALAAASIYKPPQTEVRVKTVLMVQAQQEWLRLAGSFGFETGPAGLGVFGSFTMQGKWRDPFGFRGITVADIAAQVGFMPEFPWLKELGLTGKIEIGNAFMQLAIFVDIKNPQQSGFIARGSNIRMGQMINTLTGPAVTIPGAIVGVLDEIHLRQLELQVVPQPFAIGELRFDETGITVLADVRLWSWQAYMKVRADYDEGVTAYASMAAFSIAGGLIKVGPSKHGAPRKIPGYPTYDGPQLYIQVSPSSMPEAYITGSISIFGVTADGLITLSTGGLDVKLELDIFSLFRASVDLRIKTDLSQVYVKVRLYNDFMRKLTETVRRFINQAVRAAQEKLEKVIGRIRDARKALDAAAAKWNDAIKVLKNAVESAQRVVNSLDRRAESLRRDIRDLDDEIDDLPWYKKAKAVYLAGKMAVKAAELGAVKTAAFAANLALEAARKALDIFEKANPLELILAPFKGALYAAEGVLEGAKAAVGGIAALADKALEFAGEFFAVREAMFEAEYSRLPERSSFVTIKALIVFMGRPMPVDFSIDLEALDTGAKALMERLLKPIGDTRFVPAMVDIPVLGGFLG